MDFPAAVLLLMETAEVEELRCFCSLEFQPGMTMVSSGNGNGRDEPAQCSQSAPSR